MVPAAVMAQKTAITTRRVLLSGGSSCSMPASSNES